jgi:hypothetical protein
VQREESLEISRTQGHAVFHKEAQQAASKTLGSRWDLSEGLGEDMAFSRADRGHD